MELNSLFIVACKMITTLLGTISHVHHVTNLGNLHGTAFLLATIFVSVEVSFLQNAVMDVLHALCHNQIAEPVFSINDMINWNQ